MPASFRCSASRSHPSYDFPAGDVAVLKLGAAVEGVAPTAIETTSAPPPGTPGVIVGYGRSGDPLFDYGLKRAGSVVTAPCSTIPPPGSDVTSVCWDFTNPLGPPGSNSNTCNADSGGPLFVDLGAGPRVAGITSGGSSSACLPADHSYDANVFTYRSFIQTQGGVDLANTRCGSGPQVGEVGTTVLTTDGTVSGATPQGTYSFPVASGTTLLRVAMNAVDDGVSDFDLYVKAGSAPTTSVYDCGRFGPNQFGDLRLPRPRDRHLARAGESLLGRRHLSAHGHRVRDRLRRAGERRQRLRRRQRLHRVRRLPGGRLRRHAGRQRHALQRRQRLHGPGYLPVRRLRQQRRSPTAPRATTAIRAAGRTPVRRDRATAPRPPSAARSPRRAPRSSRSTIAAPTRGIVWRGRGAKAPPRAARSSAIPPPRRRTRSASTTAVGGVPQRRLTQVIPARPALEGLLARLPLSRRQPQRRRPPIHRAHERRRRTRERAGARQRAAARTPRPAPRQAAERDHPAAERHHLLELDATRRRRTTTRALQSQERLISPAMRAAAPPPAPIGLGREVNSRPQRALIAGLADPHGLAAGVALSESAGLYRR